MPKKKSVPKKTSKKKPARPKTGAKMAARPKVAARTAKPAGVAKPVQAKIQKKKKKMGIVTREKVIPTGAIAFPPVGRH
jgi:hypothetical protein